MRHHRRADVLTQKESQPCSGCSSRVTSPLPTRRHQNLCEFATVLKPNPSKPPNCDFPPTLSPFSGFGPRLVQGTAKQQFKVQGLLFLSPSLRELISCAERLLKSFIYLCYPSGSPLCNFPTSLGFVPPVTIQLDGIKLTLRYY